LNYFYLKMGAGNCLAARWLAGENDLKEPAAVIFFDNLKEAAYAAAAKIGIPSPGMQPQPLDFYTAGLAPNREQTCMVVIHEAQLCLLRPAHGVKFLTPNPEESGGELLTRMAMPVEKLVERPLKEVPAVLAGLPADQNLSQWTFRRIGHWGNLKAIDSLLEKFGWYPVDWTAAHWKSPQEAARLLECLGSTGLETFVARVLEAVGCFVPARFGGVLRDIDLFAYNDSATPITLTDTKKALTVRANDSISVQVKTWPNGKARYKSSVVDWLIGFSVLGPGTLDGEWLLDVARQYPAVITWLQRSLNWLPSKFLKTFNL
jgi:hypothetical protein